VIKGAARKHEPEGPQIVAASFERARTSPDGLPISQRVLVMGDSDFISNGALLSYGNTALAERLFAWAMAPNPTLKVVHSPALDRELAWVPLLKFLVDYCFPFILPMALLGIAYSAHKRRMA